MFGGSNFQTKRKESLGTSWECFNALINTGPDLAIQDPILLQHFYMGLDKETSKYLNIASGGPFLHVPTNSGRNILTKVLESTLEEVEEKPLEKESQIAKPELLPTPPQTLVIPNPEPPEKEETTILDFMLEFEYKLFVEYGNISNYHTMRRP